VNIHITGIGWVTPAGMGSMKELGSFQMTHGPLPDLPLKGLGPTARRMDFFTRLGLTAIGLCLDDAGIADSAARRNFGIVATTEYACLATDSDFFDSVLESGGAGASPGLFSYTLPSTFLGEASILYQLTGPTYIVSESSLIGIAGLEMCLESILLGESATMLCGIVNPPCPGAVSDTRKLPNGALFFALQRLAADTSSYGTLWFDDEGHVQFRGGRVNDISEIVQRCLI